WRCAAGHRRIALPCTAQAGAGRLDHGRVETDREQPAREVLFAHAPGPKATRIRGGELAAAVDGHLARRPAFRDINRRDRSLCGSNTGGSRHLCGCDPFFAVVAWSASSTRSCSSIWSTKSRKGSPTAF